MVYEATAANYDEQLKAEFVVVDFYGDHCGACVYLAPFYQEAANDMPYIRFVKINISQYPEIGKRYRIKGVPTLKFFRNGEEVHEALGGRDREMLNAELAKMLYRE
ncbi:MAG: thioredoxin family protein [Lachnospiraceae bacterium]|nr:thioredoxin family protein [Lachnospiraceae bacterium]